VAPQDKGVAWLSQDIVLDPNSAHRAMFFTTSSSRGGTLMFDAFTKVYQLNSLVTYTKKEILIPKGVGRGRRDFTLKFSVKSDDSGWPGNLLLDTVSIEPV
jgi:hypothetical protein